MSSAIEKSDEIIERIVRILTDNDCYPIVTSDNIDTYQKWCALRDKVLAKGPKYYFITNCITNPISSKIMKKETGGTLFYAFVTNGSNTFYVNRPSEKMLITYLLGDGKRNCHACNQKEGIVDADIEGERFMRKLCPHCFAELALEMPKVTGFFESERVIKSCNCKC